MTNTLIGLLGAGVLAVGGWAAAAGLGDPDPARTVSLPAATSTADDTTTQDTTTQSTTTQETTTQATTTVGTTTGEDEARDISGPCDEAEHANDPRCTGAGTTTDEDDDRSGSNSGSDGDDNDDDRSGSNSGQG